MEIQSNAKYLAEAKAWAKALSSKELDHELRMHGANSAWYAQAIGEEIQERERELRELLTKHSFTYPDSYVAKCSCGWVNNGPTTYSEAWSCWMDHLWDRQPGGQTWTK
jgi:hypothetical protein